MASTRLQDVTVDSVPRSTQYLSVNDIADYPSYPMGSRKISRDIVDLFKVRMSVNEDGKPEAHYYPYTRDGKITAYKVRQLPKDFSVVGDFKNVELFGQSTCGGGKTLVVTEGEIDAMAVAEAFKQHYGRIFPVVSIPSASGTNVLLAQREWIRNFESVVILFDQDEAGKTAAEKAAKIIGLERCKIGTMQQKDASETLIEGGHAAVLSSIWNAKPWSPAGIMYGDSIWDAFMERQSVESIPYPACLDGLNQKLKGIRHGEITLFTSGTGSGKSTVIKEIILDLLTRQMIRLDSYLWKRALVILRKSSYQWLSDARSQIRHRLRKNNCDLDSMKYLETNDLYYSIIKDQSVIRHSSTKSNTWPFRGADTWY